MVRCQGANLNFESSPKNRITRMDDRTQQRSSSDDNLCFPEPLASIRVHRKFRSSWVGPPGEASMHRMANSQVLPNTKNVPLRRRPT